MFAGTSGRLSPFQKIQNTRMRTMERDVPCLLRLSLHVIERNSNEKPPRVYASLRFSGGQPLEVIARKSLYQSLTVSLSANTSSKLSSFN